MHNQIESTYGLLHVSHQNNHHYIELYLLKAILKSLKLIGGSSVWALIDSRQPDSNIILRPRKSNDLPDHNNLGHSFISSILLPNKKGKLYKFLSLSKDEQIGFDLINTRGLKGDTYVEFAFEGTVHKKLSHFHPENGIAEILGSVAKRVNGIVINANIISHPTPRKGYVSSSVFRFKRDIPIFRGFYGKIIIDTQGNDRCFKDLEENTYVVRAQIDRQRLTVNVDTSLANEKDNIYVIDLKAYDLGAKAPIVQSVLDILNSSESYKEINIDAVEALEYPEYRPGLRNGKAIGTTAVVNLLFRNEYKIKDTNSMKEFIKQRLQPLPWHPQELSVDVIDVSKLLRFDSPKKGTAPWKEDTIFDKILGDGRYVFISQLGEGAYGKVYKYFDLHTAQMVAGKHVEGGQVGNEIRTMELNDSEDHIVKLIHFLNDDETPVIIMEYVEFILKNHISSSGNAKNKEQHDNPRNLNDFLDMARQLISGLNSLHSSESAEGSGVLHGDISPSNIGFNKSKGKITWKILDFGLSKYLPASEETDHTRRLGGTEAYRSPQSFNRIKHRSSDIYSLGIIFFQVLYKWWHPSQAGHPLFPTGEPTSIKEVAAVRSFRLYERDLKQGIANPRLPPPPGFQRMDSELQLPGESDQLTSEARASLIDIIYRMMEFSLEKRYDSAEEVMTAFDQWRTRFRPEVEAFD